MYLLCQRDRGGYHKSSGGREGLPSVDEVARVMRGMRGRGGYSDVAGSLIWFVEVAREVPEVSVRRRKQVSTEQGKEAM